MAPICAGVVSLLVRIALQMAASPSEKQEQTILPIGAAPVSRPASSESRVIGSSAWPSRRVAWSASGKVAYGGAKNTQASSRPSTTPAYRNIDFLGSE
jgi:hypothetical protein